MGGKDLSDFKNLGTCVTLASIFIGDKSDSQRSSILDEHHDWLLFMMLCTIIPHVCSVVKRYDTRMPPSRLIKVCVEATRALDLPQLALKLFNVEGRRCERGGLDHFFLSIKTEVGAGCKLTQKGFVIAAKGVLPHLSTRRWRSIHDTIVFDKK